MVVGRAVQTWTGKEGGRWLDAGPARRFVAGRTDLTSVMRTAWSAQAFLCLVWRRGLGFAVTRPLGANVDNGCALSSGQAVTAGGRPSAAGAGPALGRVRTGRKAIDAKERVHFPDLSPDSLRQAARPLLALCATMAPVGDARARDRRQVHSTQTGESTVKILDQNRRERKRAPGSWRLMCVFGVFGRDEFSQAGQFLVMSPSLHRLRRA